MIPGAALVGPPPDCARCTRLAAFRRDNAERFPTYCNAPVAAFGSLDSRLLIVGLAPGLHGANRTGRPFTGDGAGDLLYSALCRHGFAAGRYGREADDGLALIDCRITNAVRCVPPENRPTGAEVRACRGFLAAELAAMPGLSAVLALGRVAHAAVLAALAMRLASCPFSHGAAHVLDAGPTLFDSYHCSRYNVNTGRLTPTMFDAVIGSLRRALDVAERRPRGGVSSARRGCGADGALL